MPSSSHAVVLLPLAVATIAGCSVSKYDEAYKSRVAAFRADAVFAGLDAAPRELAEGGRVHVHIPLKFKPVEDESRVASLRFLTKLEGAEAFTLTMTGSSGMPSTAVVVVAAVPVTKRRPADLKREVGEWIHSDAAFKDRPWQRQEGIVPSAEGGLDAWEALSLDGEQLFQVASGGPNDPPADRAMIGAGQIWVSTAPDRDYSVVICVRVPAEVSGQLTNTPAELAALMARRVRILPPEVEEPAAK